MFDHQIPGYPEDHVLEMRTVDQDDADRRAQHSPSRPGLDCLSAPCTTRPAVISPSSVAAGHNFNATRKGPA